MRGPGLAVTLALALCAAASAETGRTGGVTLSRPLGARPVALADAFVAADGGLDSLTYNPAGTAALQGREMRLDYTHGIVDDSFSFAGYGQRFKSVTLAAGLAYYDAGTINLSLSNGQTGAVKAEQDWLAVFSAAAELAPGLSAGAAVKGYRFNLAEQATASGGAADRGGQWRTPLRGLALGAAVQNLGPDVKFEQDGDPLPRTVRAGAAYTLSLDPYNSADVALAFDRFMITADAISVRDEALMAATGVEMRMPFGKSDSAALRVGYQFNSSVNGVSVGLGVRQGRFAFDYALGIEKSLGNAHHVSLGVRL